MAKRCGPNNRCSYPRAQFWRQALGIDYYSQGGGAASVIASNFKKRVEADGGTFEAVECLKDVIESLGDFYDQASFILTPNGYKAQKLYALKPTDGSGDLMWVRNSVAKRRILTGINEVAAHTPRLDFLRRESCPFVLLEPQRTKLMLHSDAFDNAAWTKEGATIDVNVVNDPEGNALADKIVEDSSDGIHGIRQDKTKAASALTYTIKFVVKAAEREWFRITVIDGNSNGYTAWFNATGSRGSFTQHGSGFSLLGYGIDEIGDGWYQAYLSVNSTTNTTLRTFLLLATGDSVQTYEGDGSSGLYVAASDMHTPALPNSDSYLPTSSSTVTRAADLVTALTNKSQLIGQAEGTIWVRMKSWADNTAKHIFFISDGTTNNRIGFFIQNTNKIHGTMTEGGETQANIITTNNVLSDIWYDLVITYKSDRFAFFVNKELIGEVTNVDVPECSVISFDSAGTFPHYGGVEIAMLLPIALTDEQIQGMPDLHAFDNFFSKVPVRHEGNPILEHDDEDYSNTCPAGIYTDPMDPTKFLFLRGEFLEGDSVGARISLFEGSKSDPYTLQFVSLPFVGTEAYDINGCRFGFHPVLHNGVLYYYYVGIGVDFVWRICLATTTDGRNFTRQGVVLEPNGIDEFGLSGPSVVKDGDTWYMCYTAWDNQEPDAPNDPGKSMIGLKLAKSSTGTSFTSTNKIIVPIGITGAIDAGHVEDGELKKRGDTWVITYSCASATQVWGNAIAWSKEIESVFQKRGTLYLAPTGSGWEDSLVACGMSFDFGNNREVIYYQAHGEMGVNDIGAADLKVI